MVWSNALPRSGRLSVTVAMRRGEMSIEIVCSVTFTPLHPCARLRAAPANL